MTDTTDFYDDYQKERQRAEKYKEALKKVKHHILNSCYDWTEEVLFDLEEMDI